MPPFSSLMCFTYLQYKEIILLHIFHTGSCRLTSTRNGCHPFIHPNQTFRQSAGGHQPANSSFSPLKKSRRQTARPFFRPHHPLSTPLPVQPRKRFRLHQVLKKMTAQKARVDTGLGIGNFKDHAHLADFGKGNRHPQFGEDLPIRPCTSSMTHPPLSR